MKKLAKIMALVMATVSLAAVAVGFSACGASAGEITTPYIVSDSTEGATAGPN